jgi:hypothetical protein
VPVGVLGVPRGTILLLLEIGFLLAVWRYFLPLDTVVPIYKISPYRF